MLVNDSFVFYDRQTESLWVHVTGEAFEGPLKGKKLKFMPSTVTTWEAWKESFPHTRVLDGRRSGPIMGSYVGMEAARVHALGLAVVVRFKGKLYPFTALAARPLVNDSFNGTELVVYYSVKARTATAWRRRLDGRVLTFRMAEDRDAQGRPLLEDEQTNSRWSWLTGEAVAGALKGSRLGQLGYNPIFNDRFRIFYPEGPVYGED